MKKILSIVIIGGFAALISCGPSAEEKAAAEKARQDSITAVMAQMAADSMAAAQAAIEKAYQDSVVMANMADSLAKAEANAKKPASKPKPKTTEQKKVEEAKKVTGGRGH